ncbi:FAD/NAD(P)-binding domain-containing protein [Byssothecium circinans]|uniref:FAD/NAD(P)-binding domain-containing protein n=1 Tax=Byssothecium circinans TaxID=147558 RepID=A0A6A5THS1_9PLEO|nr:FAD/NAD(P)-binding domain-containing protein [Byssothecium circinans]
MSSTTPPHPSQKHIVILGGSYAALSTAHYTLKHTLPSLPSTYRVILISTTSQALCRPACPRALISESMFPQGKLFVDIEEQFKQYPEGSFEFVKGTVVDVDTKRRVVKYEVEVEGEEKKEVEFWALVVGTGASTPSPLLGFKADGDETSLTKSWEEFRTGLAAAKSIVIAGGGPAGIETAGELGEYLNGRAGFLSSSTSLSDPKVSITVITAGSNILPALRPSIAKTAEHYLAKVGVRVIKETRVVSVEPPNAGMEMQTLITKAMLTLSTGKIIEADIFIPATGMTPNTSFLPSSLLTRTGQIETNTSTLRVDNAGPRIYAIGDCSSYARPAVHNILNSVPILGTNMKRDLLLAPGKAESEVPRQKSFKEDMREMQLVPIGKSRGVGAAMGWWVPSWLVWAIKGRDYWLWTTGAVWSGKQWAKEG